MLLGEEAVERDDDDDDDESAELWKTSSSETFLINDDDGEVRDEKALKEGRAAMKAFLVWSPGEDEPFHARKIANRDLSSLLARGLKRGTWTDLLNRVVACIFLKVAVTHSDRHAVCAWQWAEISVSSRGRISPLIFDGFERPPPGIVLGAIDLSGALLRKFITCSPGGRNPYLLRGLEDLGMVNEDMAIEAVLRDNRALLDLDPRWWDSVLPSLDTADVRKMLLEAIAMDDGDFVRSIWSRAFASNEFVKNDREIGLAAIKADAKVLWDAQIIPVGHPLRLDAIKQKGGGWALEYAGPEFRKDKELVLAAVKSTHGSVLKWVDVSLRADRDFMLAVVKSDGDALQWADVSLRGDKDLVLAAVESNGRALEWADASLRADRDVVLAAVKSSGGALQWADASLREDRDLCLVALTSNHAFWWGAKSPAVYIGASLRGDVELLTAAVKQAFEGPQWDRMTKNDVLSALKSTGGSSESNNRLSRVLAVFSGDAQKEFVANLIYEAFTPKQEG